MSYTQLSYELCWAAKAMAVFWWPRNCHRQAESNGFDGHPSNVATRLRPRWFKMSLMRHLAGGGHCYSFISLLSQPYTLVVICLYTIHIYIYITIYIYMYYNYILYIRIHMLLAIENKMNYFASPNLPRWFNLSMFMSVCCDFSKPKWPKSGLEGRLPRPSRDAVTRHPPKI